MSSLSPILDVIIGLAGVYVAFSLLASWINEQIASAIGKRAELLLAGLKRLFNGNDEAFKNFTSDPMFQALKEVSDKTGTDGTRLLKNPSYMSAQQFSSILMNIFAKHPDGPDLAQFTSGPSAATPAQPALVQPAVAQPGAAQPLTTGSAATPLAQELVQTGTSFINGVSAAAASLGMQNEVNGLLLRAGGDVNTFIASVESWYDDHMDRVSGWYKRWTRTMLLLIGLALAIAFNVDTIRLYKGLSCNQALRTSAATISPSEKGPDAPFVQKLLEAIPLGWPHPSLTAPIDCTSAPATATSSSTATGTTTGSAPDATGTTSGGAASATTPEARAEAWALKLVGLVLTAVALSLGAPFWFDTLSTLTRVRNTGKKPNAKNQK